MSDKETNELFDLADRFIALANELAQQQGTGSVGTAFRYAASRYNAFEASTVADDLEAEREHYAEAFSSDYRRMIEENLDSYIRHLKG